MLGLILGHVKGLLGHFDIGLRMRGLGEIQREEEAGMMCRKGVMVRVGVGGLNRGFPRS